nr:protein FAM171A2-like [Nerophis lumbriciformis]
MATLCRALVLACVCALLEAKSVHEHFDVQIKVQVLDNSDLSPLADALVEVHGNRSVLASARAGADGAARLDFRYRAATRVIISAAKDNYITNSLPWHSGRAPLYASVSLYLVVQRPGTLIVYDDVLQILSALPGSRGRPVAQLARKSPRTDDDGAALSARLTAARTRDEIGCFPYLLGRDDNGSGADSGWIDLTALALVSVELSDKDGVLLPVWDSVHISVPLPSDTRNRAATSVPTWTYRPDTGLWVRNGTGYIQKEGSRFVWNAVIPQMGYWLAAFPASSGHGLNHPGLRDITAYHTLFLLAILGSLALLVLILLCVLLYYCRRRCLKPRRQPGKAPPSNLNGAKRDQGTSTSRLNLICGGRAEPASSDEKSEPSPSGEDPGKRAAARKLRHSAGRNASGRQRGESFPMKAARASDANNLDDPPPRDDYDRGANDNRGYSSDPPSPPRFSGYAPGRADKPPEYSAADSLARPASLDARPGQIIFCSSIDQMKENMYRSMVPTLVIPAHYMRLPSEFAPKDGDEQKEADKDGAQAGGAQQKRGPPQQQQQQGGADSEEPGWASDSPGGPVTIPVLFNDSAVAQMNGELQALTEKKLLELGVKQHPRAWFISLDGRANAHVRHSYIDAGNDLSGGSACGSSPRDANLVPPPEGYGAGRKGEEERWEAARKGRSAVPGKSYSKLAFPNRGEPGGGEGRPASPEENSLTPLLDEGPAVPGKASRRRSATSPEDDKEENKKSPWQKIEDRPLMVFHPRK